MEAGGWKIEDGRGNKKSKNVVDGVADGLRTDYAALWMHQTEEGRIIHRQFIGNNPAD